MVRRRMDVAAAAAFGLLAAATAAVADQYPSRTVTIVVPFAAGGATDVAARVIGERLSENLSQQVVIENRPGANGIVGTLGVAAAAPDGYTLVMGGANTHAMNDALYKNLRYNSEKSFTPITLTARIPIAFVVHPVVPVHTINDLIELARKEPGKWSYGSSGTGGPQHLAMELFKSKAGLNIQHVPYKGGSQQLTDLLGGHIKIGSIGLPPALPNIQSGNLRAIAVTDPQRSAFLPDLPTIAESGVPGAEVSYWLGLLGPAGMPDQIVTKLHHEVVAILNRPDVREKLAKQGAEVVTSSPEEFRSLIAKEIVKWRAVAEEARITVE